ncbi:unnamed protein product [Moneuplotes crassus]|uniref:protein-tyrosine-phosphatase n=1 Tax=Euplotes crassus TaxID=5936 RepID=A0AAD1ULJ6_EUPCR|nr:unnamed protein product [Moneuplotes crassus]
MQDFNDFQEIVPNLYLGNQISATKILTIRKKKIQLIIYANGGSGVKGLKRSKNYTNMFSSVDTKSLEIEDHPDFCIKEFFDPTIELISSYLSQSKPVLIVCTAGVSRSATIVTAFIMKTTGKTFEEALQFVKEKRRFINPNAGFVKQLQEYEKELLKQRCELCALEKTTIWYTKYDTMNFKFLLCDQCDEPICVAKNHDLKLSDSQVSNEFEKAIKNFAKDFYLSEDWNLDTKQRTIKDHFHCHIRKPRVLKPPKNSTKDVKVLNGSKKSVDQQRVHKSSLALKNYKIYSEYGDKTKSNINLELSLVKPKSLIYTAKINDTKSPSTMRVVFEFELNKNNKPVNFLNLKGDATEMTDLKNLISKI